MPYWSVCCCSEVITSFAINWPEWGGLSLNYKSLFSIFPTCFKSKAHTFVVKRCRRRNNINVRCIMSSKQDLLNMKRCQLLCWIEPSQAPDTSYRHQFRRRSSSVKFPVHLGVCEGSVLVLMSESLFSIKTKKKKRNNNKWVCMWVLHAIVLICTGVPETYVARSPIKKTSSPAALTRHHQAHPKRLYDLNSSPRPRSHSLTRGGGGRSSVVKNHVF